MFSSSQWFTRFFCFVLLAVVSACGGGNGGGTNQGTGPTPPAGPPIEDFVSNLVLETVVGITPSGSRLFLGTVDGLLEIDRTTGAKRTIAGNTNIFPPMTFEQTEMYFTGVVSGDSAYLRLNQIAKTSTAADGAAAIEIIVPQAATNKVSNFNEIAANSSHTFFTGLDGGLGIQVFSQSHGQPGADTPLFSQTGWIGRLAASEDYVYLYVDGGGAAPNNYRRVYRRALATGVTTLLYDVQRATTITTILPIEADASGVYWANGPDIFFAAPGDVNGAHVISLADRVMGLVTDPSGLYVYYIENYSELVPSPNSRAVVTRVTMGPVAATELLRLVKDDVQDLAIGVEGSNLYVGLNAYDGSSWHTRLYRRNSSSGLDTLVNADQDYGLFGVRGLVVVNGKIAIAVGDSYSIGAKLIVYDIATTGVSVYRPITRVEHIKKAGNHIYMAGIGNNGITRLDLSKPYRAVDAINVSDPVGGFAPMGGTSAGGYLYFYGTYSAGGTTDWLLVRMQPDGSEYQTLHTSAGELRDPVVIGSTVYFLCHAECGDPDWVLATIDVTGGPFTPEYIVPYEPHLYGRNNYLYVTGTPDGLHGGIYAIDTAGGTDAAVVENLNYTNITLAFTETWLYWGGSRVLIGGAPARAIQRHPWVSWNSVGQGTTIVAGTAGTVDQLSEWTIATDANYLYYWHAGLKRVAH